MAFPSLAVIAQRLNEADIERLLLLKRVGPKLEKLENRRGEIARQLADVEKQITALTGEDVPKPKAQRGHETGRPTKTVGASARKPGRPAKGRSGRKPVAKGGPGASAGRAAMLKRMAKMRAAKAAKRRTARR